MLTQERVRELFDYDPETGHLVHRRLGRRVGFSITRGYRAVQVDGLQVREHRLIWLWMVGSIPDCIDHINGQPADNRWENLRSANKQTNAHNRRNTRCGLKGVAWRKHANMFRAQIVVDGSHKHLGYFATEQEAHDAYWAAAQKYFGEFARKE